MLHKLHLLLHNIVEPDEKKGIGREGKGRRRTDLILDAEFGIVTIERTESIVETDKTIPRV